MEPTTVRKEEPPLVLGIDGCRAGWVVAALSAGQGEFRLSPSIPECSAAFPRARRILIDIPIGLQEAGPENRTCDRLARRLLSPRRQASIFNPPCRAALYVSPAQASMENFRHTGKKLSRQSLNILPKIREVDEWLQSRPRHTRDMIFEAHPELAFGMLAGGQPLHHYKKTAAGKEERLLILEHFRPGVRAMVEGAAEKLPRKLVQPDDLIDALVLALTGLLALSDPEGARQVPADPPHDKTGLPMRLFYYCPPASR